MCVFFNGKLAISETVTDTVYVTGIRTLGFRRRYGRLFLAMAGLLVIFPASAP